MAFSLPIRMPSVVKRALDSPRMAALFRPSYPPHAVEVTSRTLVAVAIGHGKEGATLLEERAVDLPAGLVQPSLLRPAIADPDAFRVCLRDVLEGLPGFEGRLSLILPDRVAKVTFVDLGETSTTLTERAELIRWKLKRTTPFRVEDARISFQTCRGDGTGSRCLISLVQGEIVDQFEKIVDSLGFESGLVDLSSFNLWNLAHSVLAQEGDSLLLNVGEDYATAMIGRGGEPLFVRCKSPAGTETLAADGFRKELNPTILYYQDRIGGPGIRRAVVRAPDGQREELIETLSTRFGIPAAEADLSGLGGVERLTASRLSLLGPALGAAFGR